MVIAALKLTFAVSSDTSGHSTAKRIKDRLWSAFKVAVAELPSSSHQEVLIGVSAVGNEEAPLRDRMDQLLVNLRDWGSVDLVDQELELLHYEDIELSEDYDKNLEKYNP